MQDKIVLGISTCLLGEKVRYDGGHKLDRYLYDTLGPFVNWVPVCPEADCGLPIPREAMHLEDSPQGPRLMTIKSGIDHTEKMMTWAEKRLNELENEELCGYIFKTKSPSSGMRDIKLYHENGNIKHAKSVGLWAKAFMERFPGIPVEDEGRLNDPGLRENFIERIFVVHRWKEFLRNDGSAKGLVDFHTHHKLLIMAHHTEKLYELGRIVSNPKSMPREQMLVQYYDLLMETLKLKATVKKNTNVLDHIMGYFKKELSADEKQELKQIISNYHNGLVPLIVPVTLLNHFVRKFDDSYLKCQHYLNPHPTELMLRNHV